MPWGRWWQAAERGDGVWCGVVWCVGVQAQVKETIDATLNRISSSGVKGASYFTGACLPHAQCYLPTTPPHSRAAA